jgi:hypothetical protein
MCQIKFIQMFELNINEYKSDDFGPDSPESIKFSIITMQNIQQRRRHVT